jgi:hypothetical protein
MTPECKKIIMQGEAMLMQNHEVQNSLQRALFLMSQGTVRPFTAGSNLPTQPCMHFIARAARHRWHQSPHLPLHAFGCQGCPTTAGTNLPI